MVFHYSRGRNGRCIKSYRTVLRTIGHTRHGLGATCRFAPQPWNILYTDQELRDELFWSLLQWKSVNNVCKLLQLLEDFVPSLDPGALPLDPMGYFCRPHRLGMGGAPIGAGKHDPPLLEAKGAGGNLGITHISHHAFTLMSTPQTYGLGWLSYLSNICPPTSQKVGVQKEFAPPTFKTVAPPLRLGIAPNWKFLASPLLQTVVLFTFCVLLMSLIIRTTQRHYLITLHGRTRRWYFRPNVSTRRKRRCAVELLKCKGAHMIERLFNASRACVLYLPGGPVRCTSNDSDETCYWENV